MPAATLRTQATPNATVKPFRQRIAFVPASGGDIGFPFAAALFIILAWRSESPPITPINAAPPATAVSAAATAAKPAAELPSAEFAGGVCVTWTTDKRKDIRSGQIGRMV